VRYSAVQSASHLIHGHQHGRSAAARREILHAVLREVNAAFAREEAEDVGAALR
jgi:hypothetical protein